MKSERPRTALVTGGGSGIGLRAADELARRGYAVTLMGRDERRLAAAAQGIGDAATWSAGSVTNEADVEAAVAAATARTGALDVAVLSAGAGSVAPLAVQRLDRWQAALETNVTGAMLCIKHAAPVMAAGGGGSIVAVSSIAGRRVHRWWAAYCVSKAALDMLVRCAADELGGVGVRVNAVRPGLVPTDISADLVTDDEVVNDYLEQMPIRRLGTVDDVAAAICFLAGPESAWITGECLSVDGGNHLRRGPVLEPLVRRIFGAANGTLVDPVA